MSGVLDDPRVAQCSDGGFVVSMPEGAWRVVWSAGDAWWTAWAPAGSGRQNYCLPNVETVIGYIFTCPEGAQ